MILTGPAALVSMAATLRPGRGTRRPPSGKGRLFLHVGTHKTGTTSIQAALHAGSRVLAAQGVSYPNATWSFGGDPRRSFPSAHFRFAAALADPSGRTLPRLYAFRDRLAKALGRSRAVVLSAESLYRHILLAPEPGAKPGEVAKRSGREAYVRRLAEILDGFDPEIIIYFRRPDAFAESLYQEAAAWGQTSLTFQRFLARDVFRFDYAFQLELLRRHFPVHCFGFEAAARDDLVAHFMGVLGARIEDRPGDPVLRSSVPKRAAQWLVRHAEGARSTRAGRQAHRRRWLFALQARHQDLFVAPQGAGFWQSTAERDAFLSRSLAGFDAVEFPQPSPVVPLPEWTDEQDLRVESELKAWTARHRTQILRRELGRIAPFYSPELG